MVRVSAGDFRWLQVPVVPPSTDVFILRDVVQLQQTVPARQQAALLQHAAAARLRLQLHADPSAPDRLYAVDAHGEHLTLLLPCPSVVLSASKDCSTPAACLPVR